MKVLIICLLFMITHAQISIDDSFRIVYDKEYYMIINSFDYDYLKTIPKNAHCITITSNKNIELIGHNNINYFINDIKQHYLMDSIKIKAKIDSLEEGGEKDKKEQEYKEYIKEYSEKMNRLENLSTNMGNVTIRRRND